VDLHIDDLLRIMVQRGSSDLHLKTDAVPGFRVDGSIQPQMEFGRISADDARRLTYQILSKEQIARYEEEGDLDCSYSIEGCARFRVNVLTQRGFPGAVIRVIPDRIPTAEELGLPSVCLELSMKPRGLVLVTGPTGSGKSTTLAAMIDFINRNEAGHILTMEDPLEFMHKDQKSYVTQRQIGSDCKSFSQALRRALRQDPDVILIGEMRDLETIELAITAAETGHLVFGTLHTTSAISTVDRIIDVFPTDAQQQVRVQLATTLQGVISQCLVPRVGGGRIAAHEILIATDGVRSLIREGKTPQMLNFLQTGSKHGMATLEQRLVQLVNEGKVSLDDATAKANRPDDVRKNANAGAAAPRAPEQGEMAGMYGNRQSTPAPRTATATERPGGGASRPGGSVANPPASGGTATRPADDGDPRKPTPRKRMFGR
jgi:twitching motility protein PilT